MAVFEDGRNQPAVREPEFSDASFGRLFGIGALFGIPLTFMVVFLVVLLGTGLTEAAPAVAWADLVGGGYLPRTVS